jgi:tricorn protease
MARAAPGQLQKYIPVRQRARPAADRDPSVASNPTVRLGKEAAIIDERDNGGGDIADYIIDCLRRPLLSYWHTRDGSDITTPQESIFGPKVMIINEWAASGGDNLVWMFRKAAIGPLIGKRAWGALVGFHMLPSQKSE